MPRAASHHQAAEALAAPQRAFGQARVHQRHRHAVRAQPAIRFGQTSVSIRMQIAARNGAGSGRP
jgi:hypothetical protein